MEESFEVDTTCHTTIILEKDANMCTVSKSTHFCEDTIKSVITEIDTP